MAIEIIQGTDREFTIRVIKKSSEEPLDLTGLVGTALELKIPGENNPLVLTLTPNSNGSKLELTNALAGKIKVTIADTDTLLLKKAATQSMELTAKFGSGPDFVIRKAQFAGAITVIGSLFEA